MPPDVPRILLTGVPGAGKTTLVRRLADALAVSGIAVAGFTTRELRDEGLRVGFVVEAIGGQSQVLAHVARSGGLVVGRYRVDVAAFERIALPALERAAEGRGVVVIDEVGQMELYSVAFAQVVRQIFDRDIALVATVHARPHPVTDALKRHPGAELLTVTRGNHEELLALLTARLLDSLAGAAHGIGGSGPEP